MMKYKTKRIIIVLLMLIFFVGLWFQENYFYLKVSDVLISNYEKYVQMNNGWGYYVSCKVIYVVMILPFLVILNAFYNNEGLAMVYRHSSRKNICYLYFRQIIIIAILFSTAHITVNIMFHHILFSISFLQKEKFYLYSILQLIMEFIFFARIGIIYYLIKEKIKSVWTTMAIILAIHILIYYMGTSISNFGYQNDQKIMEGLILKLLNKANLIFSYIRQIIITFLCGYFMYNVYQGKDYLNGEK